MVHDRINTVLAVVTTEELVSQSSYPSQPIVRQKLLRDTSGIE